MAVRFQKVAEEESTDTGRTIPRAGAGLRSGVSARSRYSPAENGVMLRTTLDYIRVRITNVYIAFRPYLHSRPR